LVGAKRIKIALHDHGLTRRTDRFGRSVERIQHGALVEDGALP